MRRGSRFQALIVTTDFAVAREEGAEVPEAARREQAMGETVNTP